MAQGQGAPLVATAVLLLLASPSTVAPTTGPRVWDSTHPDALPAPKGNALWAQWAAAAAASRPSTAAASISQKLGAGGGGAQKGAAAAAAASSCYDDETQATRACATGDAGPGHWEEAEAAGDDGTADATIWRPDACRLRAAGLKELRCVLAGKRLAFLGDSLVRNLFDGIVHHAGLTRVRGRAYGTKSKQSDAFATHADSDILMQLHWAPCAIATNGLETPADLSVMAGLQWSECGGASVVGDARPVRSRNLDDLLAGFSIRRGRYPPLPRGVAPAAAAGG